MATSYAFTPIPAPRAAASRKPAIMADLAGLWRGQFMEAGGSTSSPFTLIRDASVDASVAGRFLFFTSRDVPPTGVKLLEASYATFVALIGPYYDPAENAEVVTLLEGRRDGDRLLGKFNTRLVRGWRKAKNGRFVAIRSEPAERHL
jgi:hypothetical protein